MLKENKCIKYKENKEELGEFFDTMVEIFRKSNPAKQTLNFTIPYDFMVPNLGLKVMAGDYQIDNTSDKPQVCFKKSKPKMRPDGIMFGESSSRGLKNANKPRKKK